MTLAIGVVQCALGGSLTDNVAAVERGIRGAAAQGAQILCLPELFEGPYFPQAQREELLELAHPIDDHPTLERMRVLARELSVVLPVSLFERAGPVCFNSVAVVDADGALLGVYRKSHIPDGPGYQEKFYFRPGGSGFRVWRTRYGRIGVGICWDQWFPEAARCMALLGAEVLLYPTAIGSEPDHPDEDSEPPWRRVMIGHAVANAMPVAAANRVGDEGGLRFFGSSFVADARGERVAGLGRTAEGVAVARFDRAALARYRDAWGFFRDRRPELYGALTDPDGPAGA